MKIKKTFVINSRVKSLVYCSFHKSFPQNAKGHIEPFRKNGKLLGWTMWA